MIRVRPHAQFGLLLLFLAAAAAACRDSSAPESSIAVTLSSRVTGGPTVGDDMGPFSVECAVAVGATATGPGLASWESGMLYFYEGRDQTPTDSIALTAAEVKQYWRASTIEAEALQDFELSFQAPFVFRVKIAMHYRAGTGGTRKTASTEFACGPMPAASSSPAVITALAVHPASGVFDPGQPMTVEFSARSDAGIARTEVDLSGACGDRAGALETLQTEMTRTMSFPLPSYCQSDVPLIVAVTVWDGLGATTSRQLSVMMTAVDRTAPTISPRFGAPGGPTTTELAGEYSVGDFIYVDFNAQDNHELNALVWEVLPASWRDSTLIAGSVGRGGYIRVRTEWGEGPVQLRLFARDEVGLVSNVYTSAPGAVRVVPAAAPPPN